MSALGRVDSRLVAGMGRKQTLDDDVQLPLGLRSRFATVPRRTGSDNHVQLGLRKSAMRRGRVFGLRESARVSVRRREIGARTWNAEGRLVPFDR